MGEEISKTRFDDADFARFGRHLRDETALAHRLDAEGRFAESGLMLGFEVEAWLVDHNGFPSPINEAFLRTLDDPLVVPELSRFNVELNCVPLPLRGSPFRAAEGALTALCSKCNDVAHGLDANMVMIGTLPTIRNEDLSLDNVSPLKRYYALNNEVLRQRGGRPLRIDIAGRDHLVAEHADVMLEAATTSFQVHIQVPTRSAHRYLNASSAASGPILAACGNAPFLFGHSLWDETRIPLFEQSVDLGGVHTTTRRVTFGSGYVADSLLECLDENLSEYPILLPLCFEDHAAALRHVRLHNGTIWRWNRPLIGTAPYEDPHVRIEHRVLPAGPSIPDMIANAALYVGLAHALATGADEIAETVDFETARRNFYEAARLGLDSDMIWQGGASVHAADLLLDELVPAAHRGLADLGVEREEAERYLGIVESRIRAGATGAIWQRESLARHGSDTFEMMASYCERQRSGMPVHEWDL